MYIPSSFADHDPARCFELIRAHSFGLLISQHDGEPFASHLPFLIDPSRGGKGTLIGHMARANPQWQQSDGQSVLAIFSGPHAYISPSWYESENVVPTWNYAAVHVYGTFRAIHDEEAMLKIVDDIVRVYESTMPSPWSNEMGSEYNRKLIKAVVGFEIAISRLEGKWKLSQNHPPERREKVIAALRTAGSDPGRAVADAMELTMAKMRGKG